MAARVAGGDFRLFRLRPPGGSRDGHGGRSDHVDGDAEPSYLIGAFAKLLLQAATLAGCGLLHVGAALACPGQGYCEVPGGRYLALPPPGWDGKRSLPATIFFHGWQSSAADVAGDAGFVEAFAREGVMLVLPDGVGKTWAHQGSPSRARDELAFMDAVRADLLARWPIDSSRLLVTGFSQGGSMAWDLACHRAAGYGAFAPVAGAFWEPLPDHCPGGPVDLLHIHGTTDESVPMKGRPIGRSWHQGDMLAGLAVLRAANGCPVSPARTDDEAKLSCRIWDRCASGHELRLCEHEGGHLMPDGWVHVVHDWARRLPEERQGG